MKYKVSDEGVGLSMSGVEGVVWVLRGVRQEGVELLCRAGVAGCKS